LTLADSLVKYDEAIFPSTLLLLNLCDDERTNKPTHTPRPERTIEDDRLIQH
jgi:hypothetical protein